MGSEETFLSTSKDPITTRIGIDALGSTWPGSVLRKALESVTPAPDNLAVPTTDGAPIDYAEWLT